MVQHVADSSGAEERAGILYNFDIISTDRRADRLST